MNQLITFIIPTRDNFKYIKMCYESIRREIGSEHEICIADDASTDGTEEWLREIIKQDKNVKAIRNKSGSRYGHTILYDELIKRASNDIVMIYHADMIATSGMVENMLKHMKRGTVVSATRIEPPLHPEGPEKIIANFGMEPENIDFAELSNFVIKLKSEQAEVTTNGIFAPWMIYKEDFWATGGHDFLYAPQSKEDSDIFNRFLLAGYKLVQARDAFVYHVTCRGSRFNPNLTEVGKNSKEWEAQNIRSTRNFMRKWHQPILHDKFLHPIVMPVFSIAAVAHNCDELFLGGAEPCFDYIYIDNKEMINKYIKKEQPETNIDLKNRVRHISEFEPRFFSYAVEFNTETIDNKIVSQIVNLPKQLSEQGEVLEQGVYEHGSFKLYIVDIKNQKENSLIVVNNHVYYKDGLIESNLINIE